MSLFNKQNKIEIANYGSSGGIGQQSRGSGVQQSTSRLLGADLKDSLLNGLLNENNPKELQAVYRDIYLHDAVAGSAIDLRSTLWISDFELTGVTDEQKAVFNKELERLNIKTAHRSISVDQMVSGAFIASLIYVKSINGFSDFIAYDYADCDIIPTPLYSAQPILRLLINPELKAFALDKSEVAEELKQRIPESVIYNFANSKYVDLDPTLTVYLPRGAMSTTQEGISYLRRVVPIYLLERILFRGTITEATKRQRSLLHITAGDEEWIPSADELGEILGLFQRGEQDPISSSIATRNGINVNEIRTGGDFWKWTDVESQLAYAKMRALGINEGFLSGDSVYGMESALTVFIESLISHRNQITQELYYNKLFPLISKINGFVKEDKETASFLQDKMIDYKLNDSGKFIIPKVEWTKKLKPEADKEYLDVLDALAEKGIPIGLRTWAAAGGMDLGDIDVLKSQLEKDKELRDLISQFKPKTDDDDLELGSVIPEHKNILNRNYGSLAEPYILSRTGKKKHVYNGTKYTKKQNEKIHKALVNISDKNEYAKALSTGKKYAQ